jgi:hypothetical protein
MIKVNHINYRDIQQNQFIKGTQLTLYISWKKKMSFSECDLEHGFIYSLHFELLLTYKID